MSHLSTYEFVKIVSTIEAQYTDAFNCYKCCSRFNNYKEGESKDKKIHALKKSKGCFDFKTRFFRVGVDSTSVSVKFSGCVGNYTSLSVNYYVDLFYQYQKGVLPFKGKLGDQPSKIIEIFQLIEDKIAQKNKERMEKESRKKKNGK